MSQKQSGILIALLLFFAHFSFAGVSPLPAEQAFRLAHVTVNNGKITTAWQVARGYYLYQDRFNFEVMDPAVMISAVTFPENFHYKSYPDGTKMRAFSGNFSIQLSTAFQQSTSETVKLRINYQGCSEQGICYPKQQKIVSIHLSNDKTALSQQGKLLHLLNAKKSYFTLLVFFGMGILLSLTPCVLPMLPILSSIILGQKKITLRHSFMLSLVYVLSIATTFAIFGIIAGTLGKNLQAMLQKPWIIISFSGILIAMALALFGVYNLQLPTRLRGRLANISAHQKRGTYSGVAIMGCLSVLISSPCITPPLAAAIIYLGDQGNIFLSAAALFLMGTGIGTPLLIIGAVGPRLLPRTGSWMNSIKCFFGLLMLAVAIWMLSRILSPKTITSLWGALAIGTGVMMGAFSVTHGKIRLLVKFSGILVFSYGIFIIAGALHGSTSALKPLKKTPSSQAIITQLPFIRVTSLSQLQAELEKAKQQQRPAMVDFFADWCVTCHRMDATLFANDAVIAALKPYVLIRADVTRNDAENQALQQHFQVIAPPTILFFNPAGQEISTARIVGDISVKKFLRACHSP